MQEPVISPRPGTTPGRDATFTLAGILTAHIIGVYLAADDHRRAIFLGITLAAIAASAYALGASLGLRSWKHETAIVSRRKPGTPRPPLPKRSAVRARLVGSGVGLVGATGAHLLIGLTAATPMLRIAAVLGLVFLVLFLHHRANR